MVVADQLGRGEGGEEEREDSADVAGDVGRERQRSELLEAKRVLVWLRKPCPHGAEGKGHAVYL